MTSSLLRQWLFTLLLGSTFYGAFQGVLHFSDWCYLAVATATAGIISALLVPLNAWLLRCLAARGPAWPALGRWAWLLGGTALLFGLANGLALPLLTWLGPGGTWPWGGATLVVAVALRWPLLQAPVVSRQQKEAFPAS